MSTINSAKKPLKGRPVIDSEAVNVRIERQLLAALDNWRRNQHDLPSRPEAIRRLINLGVTPVTNPAPAHRSFPAWGRRSQHEEVGSPIRNELILKEQEAFAHWVALGLETRTANALVDDNILTVSDLPSDPRILVRIPNIGKVGLASIEQLLARQTGSDEI